LSSAFADFSELIAKKLNALLYSLLGLCLQDYKSLCAAVIICVTLVNIQTHTTHTDSILISLYEKLSHLS